jgi:hypothetical protein
MNRVLDYSNPLDVKFRGPGFMSIPVFHRVVLEVAICLLPAVFVGAGENVIVSALLLSVICCTAVFWYDQRRRRFPVDESNSRHHWRVIACLTLLMCVLLVQFDRCPHATYLMIGPCEFSTAPRCGNMRFYRNVVTWFLFPR